MYIFSHLLKRVILKHITRITTSTNVKWKKQTMTLSSRIWYPTVIPTFSVRSLATRSATEMAAILRGWVQMMLATLLEGPSREESKINWGTWVVFPHLQRKKCVWENHPSLKQHITNYCVLSYTLWIIPFKELSTSQDWAQINEI